MCRSHLSSRSRSWNAVSTNPHVAPCETSTWTAQHCELKFRDRVLEKASASVGTARTFRSLRLILCWEANLKSTCPNQLAKRLSRLRLVGTKLTLVLSRFSLHRAGSSGS